MKHGVELATATDVLRIRSLGYVPVRVDGPSRKAMLHGKPSTTTAVYAAATTHVGPETRRRRRKSLFMQHSTYSLQTCL